MTRYLYSFIALACLLAGSVQAQESHNGGIGFSESHGLFKIPYTLGRTGIEIYAGNGVDVPSLLSGLDLPKSASPQTIADRINAKRKELYPDEEIVLSIAPAAEESGIVGEKVGLVRAIYWWNNANCSTCSWYAQYNSTVATLFVDDVQGAYKVYTKEGSSAPWVFHFNVTTGGSLGGTTYGKLILRGFQGLANGVSSQADIVMYFFK